MEITINNLTKKYKDFVAVDNISFKINQNETFALLGINGAGKTTAIKMMTGLIDKTSGSIFYDELNIDNNLDKIKSFINISPQETAVAENLTVYENIFFIAQIYGLSKQEATNKTNEIIHLLSLKDISNKKAKFLSGGMQRKLSIAMSLVSGPKVLFLDEPSLGLDVLSREEMWQIIKALKTKMSIILTTHYMEEAENLADKVAIINKGKIITIDTPANLLKQTNSKSLEKAFIKIIKGAK